MGKFAEIYTHEQREAAARAYVDLGVKPAHVVSAKAAAGELEYNGRKLDAFTMPAATVRDCARVMRKRRAGELASKAIDEPDAVYQLKRRLLSMTEAEITVEERKKEGTRDGERIRQLARALREAAAIPEKGEPRRPVPGQRDPKTGEHDGGRTDGGLAGAIKKAAGL